LVLKTTRPLQTLADLKQLWESSGGGLEMTSDGSERTVPSVPFQTGRGYEIRRPTPTGGYVVLNDREQLAAVVEDLTGHAENVAGLWRWSVLTQRRAWRLVVRDAQDDREVARAFPRGEVTRYRLEAEDGTICKLRQNPLSGRWRLVSRHHSIATLSVNGRFYDRQSNRVGPEPSRASAGRIELGPNLPHDPSRSALIITTLLCVRFAVIYQGTGGATGP
jgi:hypothetical protein